MRERGLRRLLRYGAMALVVNAGMGTAMAEAAPIRLLALGDSLTAGYGLAPEDAFPVRLQRALRAEGWEIEVINAGVSGDTAADGRARLDWALAAKPDAAIVEFGANDALRGLDPDATDANLDAILTRLERDRLPVLLAGMLAPPNLGRDYTDRFRATFTRLTKAHDVVFYPFFLDGVAAHPEMTLPDGLHPSPRGVATIVAAILPSVRQLLGRVRPGPP